MARFVYTKDIQGACFLQDEQNKRRQGPASHRPQDAGHAKGAIERDRKACGAGSYPFGRPHISYNGKDPRVEPCRPAVHGGWFYGDIFHPAAEEKVKVKQ
jgi:hypothetical protein